MLNDLKLLGRACRTYRQKRGVTQADVANQLGYSVENISAFETGRNDNCRILLWYFENGMTINDVTGVCSHGAEK